MNLDISTTTAAAINKLTEKNQLSTLIFYLNNLEDERERKAGLGKTYLNALERADYEEADTVKASLQNIDLRDLSVNLEELVVKCIAKGEYEHADRLAAYNSRTLTGTELKDLFDFHLAAENYADLTAISQMMNNRLIRVQAMQDEAHD